MLSEKSRPVIEATLPVIAERIGFITKDFYKRMFGAHPELLDGMFSRANQKIGAQQQALAGAIAVFAVHLLEHPDTLPEQVLSRIANKHTALDVQPEQYQIVYENLFAAIAADLGDAVTPEVAEAWSEVYWLMADALIDIERGLYSQRVNDVNWSPWRLIERIPAGTHSVTFVFEPADDTPVCPARAGQYVSVRVRLADGLRQCRQYSLSSDAESLQQRRFTVKYEKGGEVSPFLHESLKVGDVVELSNPYGDFTTDLDDEAPLLMISAGIGCTPTAATLESLAARHSKRPVYVYHADRSEDDWALAGQMREQIAALDNADLELWLDTVDATGEADQHVHRARLDLATAELPTGVEAHLCGPIAFMRETRSKLIERGVPADRVHYEVFGPDVWLGA